MNKKTKKILAQDSRADTQSSQIQAFPCRSLTDCRTWQGLQESIENIRHSAHTIFRFSGKCRIEAFCAIEPIFLYDSIILGLSGDKMALLFDGEFKYEERRLLLTAIRQENYDLAKLVFGTSIARYILNGLESKYEKAFDVNEYCDLVRLTFDFKMHQLNSSVSEWVCSLISGQADLEDAPAELRTANFQFWEDGHLPNDMLKYRSQKDFSYSVGCFLENVII